MKTKKFREQVETFNVKEFNKLRMPAVRPLRSNLSSLSSTFLVQKSLDFFFNKKQETNIIKLTHAGIGLKVDGKLLNSKVKWNLCQSILNASRIDKECKEKHVNKG